MGPPNKPLQWTGGRVFFVCGKVWLRGLASASPPLGLCAVSVLYWRLAPGH